MPCRACSSAAGRPISAGSCRSASCRRSPSSCPSSSCSTIAGLRDTHLGLILVHTLINLPIAVLLMKSFFDDVPSDVDEAAMIDGATRFQTFCTDRPADGEGRRRGDGGAVLHLLLDRIPAVAVPHHLDPHPAGQDHRPSSRRPARNGASSRRSARPPSCRASSSSCSCKSIWFAASPWVRSRTEPRTRQEPKNRTTTGGTP